MNFAVNVDDRRHGHEHILNQLYNVSIKFDKVGPAVISSWKTCNYQM